MISIFFMLFSIAHVNEYMNRTARYKVNINRTFRKKKKISARKSNDDSDDTIILQYNKYGNY